jgi:hypothetical protein
MASNQS